MVGMDAKLVFFVILSGFLQYAEFEPKGNTTRAIERLERLEEEEEDPSHINYFCMR